MSLSRRRFLSHSALSAATIPLLMNLDVDYCEAGMSAPFDLSMGFPENAIRLNFNENTLGPSAQAIAGAKAAIHDSYRYALGGLLRPFLADHHAIDKDWILLGTGSTELLRLAPLAFARTGGNVVGSLVTWNGSLLVAENMGVAVRRVKPIVDDDYDYDVRGLLDAIDADTRMVYIATPNNPTGSSLRDADFETIADALPPGALLVLDEAYTHYLPDGRKTGLDLVKAGYRNVLATRTFSKAHALAGMRCGYGLAHPDVLREITKFGCGPGSTNFVAFGAVQGALADPDHVRRSRDYVQKSRSFYRREFEKLGLGDKIVSGVAPFMLVELGESAGEIRSELMRRNIFVGTGKSWHIPRFLRISYGTEAENQAFFSALKTLV